MDHNRHVREKGGFFASRANIALVGFLAISGFYLVTEHRAHLIPYLPWLFLAACPLMHVFMHHGHGGHQHHGGRDEPDRQRNASEPGSVTPPGPGYGESRSTSQHQHGERS